MMLRLEATREGRLSSFLLGELNMSTGLMNRLKWGDALRVNGKAEHTDYPVKPGDVMVATFEQEMDLQGKDYLLSLGCTGFVNGEFVVFDRLYDVANLTVISDKNTVGYFDMNSQVTVEGPAR